MEQELVTSVHVDGKTEYQGEKDRPAICHSQISSNSGIVVGFSLLLLFNIWYDSWIMFVAAVQYLVL